METGRGAKLNEFDQLFGSSSSTKSGDPADRINIQVFSKLLVYFSLVVHWADYRMKTKTDRLFPS